MSALVSIIIPVYNVESYLGDCIDSILAQNYKDIELICVNDGSPDHSPELLRQYAAQDMRVRVLSQENSGLSSARNTGMEQAKGEYMMFVDSDDIIPQGAVSYFVRMLEQSGCDVALSKNIVKAPAEGKLPAVPEVKEDAPWCIHENALPDLLKMRKAYSPAWNKMYRSKVLRNKRFIKGLYFEDWPFTTTLFSDVDRFVSTDQALYIYRSSVHSIVRSSFTEEKIQSFAQGARYVASYKSDAEYQRIVKKRNAQAMAMCINKTYRDKAKRRDLASCLRQEVLKLQEEGVIDLLDLPLKSLFRFWYLACLVSEQKAK